MPRIIVDGREIQAKDSNNLLEVLLSADIDMPYFCWHPAMGSVGACRQCAVVSYAGKDDERGRIVMSCMTPVADGARFSVRADDAVQFRHSVIENLMLNHPHDCPVCEEGGECHLQDMTVMVGHRDRRYTGHKTTFHNQYLGPFIGHEMNRCITCYRCVRFYQDYAGGNDLNAFGSRDRVFFGRAEPGVLASEFAGNLVEVCPTGVFTDKTLSKHYTRKWDLQSAPTVCQGCSLGCNTYTSERYGELRRVHNRYHDAINGYFLCDRGRFGGQHVNTPLRIPQAGIRNAQGTYDAVPLSHALDAVRALPGEKMVGIGSPRASLEANEALRQLVGPGNYAGGMSDNERSMTQVILDVLASNLHVPSMMEVEQYDAILVVGEDITNHAPRLALSVRQAVQARGATLAAEVGIAPWHDAAVRELAQHETNPLIVLSPMSDRLDGIASETIRLAPNDIVTFVSEITDALDSDAPSHAKTIADTLTTASRPLIVSGTSLGSANVLRSAANLARALADKNPAVGIVLCPGESNSVGVGLIDNESSTEALLDSKPDIIFVLENDIASRLGRDLSDVEKLVVIDYLDSATASASHIVLPAASFAEAEGSFVNNEARVQRSFAVFPPAGDITPAYHILSALGGEEKSATEMQRLIAREHPALARLGDCAPDETFRVKGARVARQTHRASGRTAILANVSVHEPQPAQDTESALAFTMEGNQSLVPSTLRPYTWSPGWNSNQSIHKYQGRTGSVDETGGVGLRLFDAVAPLSAYSLEEEPPRNLIGQHHIFGSDPVTAHAEELASLAPGLYARMNTDTARLLNVAHRDGLQCGRHVLTVLIEDDVAENCIIYPVLPELSGIEKIALSQLQRIDGYEAPGDPMRPSLIMTDRTH